MRELNTISMRTIRSPRVSVLRRAAHFRRAGAHSAEKNRSETHLAAKESIECNNVHCRVVCKFRMERDNRVNAAESYFEIAMGLLQRFRATQTANVDAAAEICANSIAGHGLVFVFGSGHSRFMCDEMTPRQGGFVGFYALVELAFSNHSAIVGSNGLRVPLYLEKYVGLGEEILKSFQFGPNDSFLLVSTSGIRPLIVEMALGARARGLKVIALVSRQHSDLSEPNHPSGKKLIDLADVVIDNQCPPGDCAQMIDGLEWPTGPISTLTGAMAINMIRSATAEKLISRGVSPVVLPSHHFPGRQKPEEALEQFYEAYRKSLAHLYQ
jgi:uncharacterized phosphosugar-binding protein